MNSFEIILDEINIKIKINRKKIKNIYFRIDDDLNLVVSASNKVKEKEIVSLINKNKTSILKMYQKIKSINEEKKGLFIYLGNKYRMIFDKTVKNVEIYNDYIIIPNIEKLNKFISIKCQEIFNERVNKLKLMYYNLPDFKLRIRKMKTRWGVCNFTKKIITLNSELITKDVSLIDYVIIHELCHFKYQDHSKSFWDEVAKYYPYYKSARKMLRNI